MITQKAMITRQTNAKNRGVYMTNFGVLISKTDRVTEIFR